MFKESLLHIIDDLNKASTLNRDDVFESFVKKTLQASYERYDNNLKINCEYLLMRDNLKVLKTIAREKKKNEKHND